jgi:hypothetical protein
MSDTSNAAIAPAACRYIKLGAGGAWEAASLDSDRIYWGNAADAHEHAAGGDWEAKKFTAVELTDQALEYGTWRGPYQLRLYHSFGGEAPNRGTGYIGVDVSGRAILTCRGKGRHPYLVPLGKVGEKKGSEVCSLFDDSWCDFDAWAIEPVNTERSFFDGTPRGQRSWLLDLQLMVPRFA